MEDDDIKLHRATGYLLTELEALIPKILWKTSPDGSRKLHRYMRDNDLYKAKYMVEPFQEDPQLLDAKLKALVSPLADALVACLDTCLDTKPRRSRQLLYDGICRILNLFCKVRGEKVILGFFNNEPRYLEPLLLQIEQRTAPASDDEGDSAVPIMAWEERYVSLLWLSHLTLTPFELSTVSSISLPDSVIPEQLSLSGSLPGVAKRIISLGVRFLGAVSKERAASAKLIVKLCMRPDMRKYRLMESVMEWTLWSLRNTKFDDANDSTHQTLGYLSVASGIVASASTEELGNFISHLHDLCMRILNDDLFGPMRSSAVARKLLVKISRNVVIHSLRIDMASGLTDSPTILEDVIDVLLQALGDGDTPVRFAASKSLSMIAMKLDDDMGEDVIDAVLGLLNRNVIWTGSERDLSLTNALEWHGITLTLAHLLFRRAPSPQKLPEIINALLLALSFEQRSMTGGSIGTNVRDAANFGIWALARRYFTAEISAIDPSLIPSARFHEGVSTLQNIAVELILSACLDPAGNIRRGSSAALQELIGRHPDQIYEGISLVQVVDYHAVGLRTRALCEVSVKASALHKLYWQATLSGLLTWRGVGALDASSRRSAARAVGFLVAAKPTSVANSTIVQVRSMLKGLSKRQVEERHGLLYALASILEEYATVRAESRNQMIAFEKPRIGNNADPETIDCLIWKVFQNEVKLKEGDFTSVPLRPALTAEAVCSLLTAICHSASKLANFDSRDGKVAIPPHAVQLLNWSFRRSDDTILELVPAAVRSAFELADEKCRDKLISTWLGAVRESASSRGRRGFGLVVALGALFEKLKGRPEEESDVLDILSHLSGLEAPVDRRIMAVQSLGHLIDGLIDSDHPQKTQYMLRMIPCIATTLNDYTINERGDVGSLVRIEAIRAVQTMWKRGAFGDLDVEGKLYAGVLRLSVEKLDKTRVLAAEALLLLEKRNISVQDKDRGELSSKVASYAYFQNRLALLDGTTNPNVQRTLLEGYISSAGMGSESLVQTSRKALADALNGLSDDKLVTVFTEFTIILKESISVDRVVLPLLEVFSFLLDVQIFQKLRDTGFKWRNLLALVQKTHFKSSNMQKLSLSLAVYRGLLEIPLIRADVLSKVSSMLLHPFPKIRAEAAEVLYMATKRQDMKSQDWSLSPKALKPVVEKLRENIT